MGNILTLKNADFSENAVPVENIYDIVKQTDIDIATPHYPMTATLTYYNTIALTKTVKIYAVSFVLQETAENIDLSKNSRVLVGATADCSTVVRYVSTSITDIASAFKNGTIEPGSKQTIALSSPLIVNAGEYIMIGHGSGDNRIICYSRNVSGQNGRMRDLGGSPDTSTYTPNLAATFYGVELY